MSDEDFDAFIANMDARIAYGKAKTDEEWKAVYGDKTVEQVLLDSVITETEKLKNE